MVVLFNPAVSTGDNTGVNVLPGVRLLRLKTGSPEELTSKFQDRSGNVEGVLPKSGCSLPQPPCNVALFAEIKAYCADSPRIKAPIPI